MSIDEARFETALPRDQRSRLDLVLLAASGSLDAVDNNVKDLRTQGGVQVQPTVAGVLRVKSTSALDNPGGTGAGFVLINALDPQLGNTGGSLPADVYTPWAQLILPLDGTNWVTAPNTWLRALLALTAIPGATAPAEPTNIGVINVEIEQPPGSGTFLDILEIPVGKGISANSNVTVPAGWTAVFDRLFISTNVTVNLSTRGSGLMVISAIETEITAGTFSELRFDPVPATSGIDTKIQVVRPGGAAAGKITVLSNQVLVRDET